MSQGSKECPKCKADVPVASMRCTECGARFNLEKPGLDKSVQLNSKSSSQAANSSNDLSMDEMMAMASKLSSSADSKSDGTSTNAPNSVKKVIPKPVTKRPSTDVGVTKSSSSTGNSSDASRTKLSTPPLRRPAKPLGPASSKSSGSPSASSETQTSSSDSSLVSKKDDQGSSSQSSIIRPSDTSNSSSQSGVSTSGSRHKRKRTTPHNGNSSGVFSQEALGNKVVRGSKRVLANINPEVSTVNNEELQHAIRTAVNQPEPEILPLTSPEDDKSKKKKTPSLSQLQKQALKLATKLEAIKDDDTKTTLDTTRETLKELSSYGIPDVVNVIASYIQDVRPTIGDSATKALGESRQPSALPFILKQLMSAEKTRVVSSIISLGALGDRRAVLPLIVTSLEFPQFSLRVLDSIEQIGAAGVPALIELAQHQELGICLNSTIALGKLKDPRGLDVLMHLLDHDSMNVRCHAAEALGEIGNKKCCSSLVRKLNDEKAQVRVNSVVALGKLADEDAATGLLRCLKDSDEDVIAEAAKALGNCNGKIALEPLHKLLGSANDNIVLSTCSALGKIGNEQTAMLLTKLLYVPESPSESHFIIEVIDAIKKLKSPQSVPGLIDILDSTDATVRQRIAESLGFIGDSHAAIPLENIFEQEKSDEVRAAIIKALGEIGDHDSFDVVIKALDDVMIVRIKAVIALGQLKDEAALMYLTPMLNDPSPELRYHSSMALAEIGKKTVIHQIEPLVLDENNLVQRGAFKALQKLGDERPEKEIIKSAKKRAPRKAVAPAISIGLDFASFVPDSMVGMISPDNPMLKWIVIGIGSSILLITVGVATWLFWPKPTFIVRMGYPVSIDPGKDGSTLAIGRSYGVSQLVTRAGDEQSKTFIKNGTVTNILNLGDKRILVAMGTEVFEVNNGSLKTPDKFATTSPITALKYTHYGALIYTLDGTKALRIYDAASLQFKSSLTLPPTTGNLAISESGELVAIGTNDGSLFILKGAAEPKALVFPKAKKPSVTALAFSQDAKILAASYNDGSLITWSIETGKVEKVHGNPASKVPDQATIPYHSLRVLNDSKKILGIGTTKSHIFGVEEGKIIKIGRGVNTANFNLSRDNKFLALTENEDVSVYLLNLEELDKLEEIEAPTE